MTPTPLKDKNTLFAGMKEGFYFEDVASAVEWLKQHRYCPVCKETYPEHKDCDIAKKAYEKHNLSVVCWSAVLKAFEDIK